MCLPGKAHHGTDGWTERHPQPPTGISKKASRLLGQSSHRVSRPKNRGAGEGWQEPSAPSLCSLGWECRVALGPCRGCKIRAPWVSSQRPDSPLCQAAGSSPPSRRVPALSFCPLPIPHLCFLPCQLLPVTWRVRVGLWDQSSPSVE